MIIKNPGLVQTGVLLLQQSFSSGEYTAKKGVLIGKQYFANNESNLDLYLFLEINHINKLNTAFKNRFSVMICEKVFDSVRANKTAFFIKWDG